MTESDPTDLSPWAHPKAKAWFGALFRRTNFPLGLENEIRVADDQLSLSQLRMMLAFALLLGRKEMWPAKEMEVLKQILKKTRERVAQPPTSSSGKPFSVAEHQNHQRTVDSLAQEIELVRRRLGSSMRKTPMKTPDSWGKFWQ